jgi:Membrane-bound metallopeptidase
MDKFKILSIACIVIGIISGVHIGYNNYQARKQLKKDKLELTNRINELQQTIEKNNKIIADNEQSKHQLENESISRQEQINEQLKDIDCANQFVPIPVSNSMYNRAKNLRQSTSTSESIK